MEILLPCMYLPPIAAFVHLSHENIIHLELSENYVKGTFRNTAQIAGPNGKQLLKVPVKKLKNGLMSEVKISNDENWRRIHLRSIETAYGTAPFFEYYIGEIQMIYKVNYEYLWELNLAFIKFIINKLQLNIAVEINQDVSVDREINNRYNLMNALGSKISQVDHSPLKPYPQVFEYKYGWQNDLSILDLIMCLGPMGKSYIEDQEIKI